jgi:sulfopyruvate decarboxylase subunit beta
LPKAEVESEAMAPTERPQERMALVECLAALHAACANDVVITTMATAREWQKLGSRPLDFVLAPSSMGQATSLGLGIALARPERRVIVCNGDGSMLMNLGSLVTISGQSPPNLTVIVFDNAVYEVTGAQPTPGASAGRADGAAVDFAAVARACGFTRVWRFSDLASWKAAVRDVIAADGPSFVHLVVAPLAAGEQPSFSGSSPERARTFREQLTRAE